MYKKDMINNVQEVGQVGESNDNIQESKIWTISIAWNNFHIQKCILEIHTFSL